MKKIVYSLTAIICCLILGFVYYSVEINKQRSIEQQKVKELSNQKTVSENKKNLLQDCLSKVHDRYKVEGKAECERRGYSEKVLLNLVYFVFYLCFLLSFEYMNYAYINSQN